MRPTLALAVLSVLFGACSLNLPERTFDAQAPEPDQSAPAPDLAPDGPEGASCADVYACMSSCAEGTCLLACQGMASQEAKVQINALSTCLSAANTGPCAPVCVDPGAPECSTCLVGQCRSEYEACGALYYGFGAVCDQQNPCPDNMYCVTLAARSGKGFCTTECSDQSKPCEGTPPKTMAGCAPMGPSSNEGFCVFVCEAHGQTYPCPGGLRCPDSETPPGSGQRICEPH